MASNAIVLDLKGFQSAIPALNDQARKGTAGRIAIVGGSKNYSGAPYYAAMACLRVGGDLAYVVCCKQASASIKGYSPELIVSPILDDELFKSDFLHLLPKLHSVVIGPGLGRKKEQFQVASEIIQMARRQELPITIDADAVLLIADSPELVKGYDKTILTPNAREFDYLCDKLGLGGCGLKVVDSEELMFRVKRLSNILEGVTVVRKGKFDHISNGLISAECTLEGSFRRCGGQGDILAGAIGTFSYWAFLNEASLPLSIRGNSAILAAYAGCCLTRRTSFLTFKKLGRSMLTTDMLSYIGEAFASLGLK